MYSLFVYFFCSLAKRQTSVLLNALLVIKELTIISPHHDRIAIRVTEVMDRGVTVLRGYGYYTGQTKDVLYIVISKQEVSMLKKIVRAEDKDPPRSGPTAGVNASAAEIWANTA